MNSIIAKRLFVIVLFVTSASLITIYSSWWVFVGMFLFVLGYNIDCNKIVNAIYS